MADHGEIDEGSSRVSKHIGNTITGFDGQGVQVNTFTGPNGVLGVSITPMSGPVDYLWLREAETRKLIQLLEAALRGKHVGTL